MSDLRRVLRPSPGTVLVMLCVNDDHGNNSGHVCKAEFENGERDTVLELESQWGWDEDEPCPHATFRERDGVIVVDGTDFAIVARKDHVGNLHWNAYRMTIDLARALAVDLRMEGWHVSAWTKGQRYLPARLLNDKPKPATNG